MTAITVPWLEPNSTEFPDVSIALEEPNGLLAAGGDLNVERLLAAYRAGIFPWYEDGQPIVWWSPNPRWVLYPDELHVSRSLRRTLKKQPFRVSFNEAFPAVIQQCAAPRATDPGTWITRAMSDAYNRLNRLGLAHSVETWSDDRLVGGLYGVALGSVFFGESMFSRRSDASKVAFYYLVEHLRDRGFTLIDCQVHTEHLESLGAREITRQQFTEHLRREIGNSHQSQF